jgi:dTDP-4-amino-4,6-dideoxygalactose transaminase
MSPEAEEAVAEVLASGYIGQGAKVDEFEEKLQLALHLPAAPLTTNSCTSALDLALELIGVGQGDEVITTPMTCTATNGVIVKRGARPVWADVHKSLGLIDPYDVFRKITPRTKAIMAVDWGGAPADYELLKTFGLPVIQDAAHSFGGTLGGDYVCWSFQAIKHLTTGDGGALLAPPEQMERGRLLRWYGLDRRSSGSFRCEQDITEAGFKYHMNDIAASIGLANLPLALDHVDAHWQCANEISRGLFGHAATQHPWWFFTVVNAERDALSAHLAERGIESSPVHARNDKHTAFNFPNGPLPGVDYFSSHMLAVPCGWWLVQDEIEQIIEGLESFANRREDRPALEKAGYGARCR